MRRSWSIAGLGVAIAVTAGCTSAEPPATPTASTSPSAPLVFYYSTPKGDCPAIKSPSAERFSGVRAARTFPGPPGMENPKYVRCAWLTEPAGTQVNATFRFYQDGREPWRTAHGNAQFELDVARAELAAQKTTDPPGSILSTERVTSWGPSVVIAEGVKGRLSQLTVAGNATVTIELIDWRPSRTEPTARAEQLMADLTATADQITTDVAGHLVRVE